MKAIYRPRYANLAKGESTKKEAAQEWSVRPVIARYATNVEISGHTCIMAVKLEAGSGYPGIF